MQYGPGVDSASNRNEYQESYWGVKGGQCVRLTTLLLSVSRLSGENVGASMSQPYGPSWPVRVIVFFYSSDSKEYYSITSHNPLYPFRHVWSVASLLKDSVSPDGLYFNSNYFYLPVL
jgi:hypothetical protein